MKGGVLVAGSALAVAALLWRRRRDARRHRWWPRNVAKVERPLTVGVLGAADIAKKNVRALSLVREARCVAVASRARAKAAAFVAELAGDGVDARAIRAVEGYGALLADETVEAVYVPLPTALHLAWVRAALAAGKHVLLEKPIALSAADAREMARLALAAGKQLMDGTMFVHTARCAALRAAARSAEVGALRRVNASFSFCGGDAFEASNIRVRADGDPLGCLGDLGWYCVRAALEVTRDARTGALARPLWVRGHGGAVENEAGVLVECGATVAMAGGVLCAFDCSFRQAFRQRLELVGDRGAVAVDDFVLHDDRSGPFAEHDLAYGCGLDDYACDQSRGTRERGVRTPLPLPQEALMWREFARCAAATREGGQPEGHWPAAAVLTQEVLCAIQESLRADCASVAL